MEFNGPIRLDDPRFTTPQIAALSGVPEKSIYNWSARGVLTAGTRTGAGHIAYSLLDAIRLAAMLDLTTRVRLRPSDAVDAAELVIRYVLKHAPTDEAGHPLADANAISRTIAYAFSVVDGEVHVGLVDPARPGGYMDFTGSYGRAHVVLPISALVAGVLFRLFEPLPGDAP